MQDLFSLAGKKALVTGAAQGIGREIALGLAAYGADVAIADLQAEKLQEVAAAIAALGRQSLPLTVDLGSLEQIKAMVDKTVQDLGGLDIAANVAGVNVHKPALDMTEADWDFVLDINLKSVFFCCQAEGAVMVPQGQGRIINISSTFGVLGFASRTAYAASKAAVANLTKTLALEWSPSGVNVNAIAPGPVWTPARDELFSNPRFMEGLLAKLPIRRVAKPGDIVGPAIFLASPASAFMTGATLLVDGGWCA